MNAHESLMADVPHYLDDDGNGERCFLLHRLAANAGEAKKIIEHMGFEWDFRGAEADVVAMRPAGDDDPMGDSEWYDEVPLGTPGSVLYWRFKW